MAEAPISLYIDLDEGAVADLQVVAKAALAWDSLIKEVVYVLDPSLQVRVELVSGTEGSLSLNSILKAIGTVAGKHPKIQGAVVGILIFFAMGPVEHVRNDLTDKIFELIGHFHGEMPEAERRELADQVTIVLRDNVAAEEKKTIFRELERDPAIAGVGATDQPGIRPNMIVPRAAFPAMAGVDQVETETVDRRTVRRTLTVALISPVLKPGDRMWRFQHGSDPEFSAKIKDAEFLDALRTGRTAVPLKFGVEMELQLEITEERVQGVWTVKERNVLKVLSPRVDRAQSWLEFPAD